jgi:hypothetical protein
MKIFNRPGFFVFNSIVLIALFSVSCEKDKISGDVLSDPQLVSELYSKSIDTLSFESSDYILELELYRDFFPGGPVSKRRPLEALIYLVNIDNLPVTGNLSIIKLYVINSDQIWIANLREGIDPYIPDFKLDKLNTDGPEWETGIYVNVIIEVKNKLTMKSYYIIARHQYIQRIE